MLVVHPDDRSTDFLSVLYTNHPNVVKFNGLDPSMDLGIELLRAMHDRELTMFLGHGMPSGLINITHCPGYGNYLINRETADLYLKDRVNLFGMFCYANKYAIANHLKGLWSGMIISEVSEAMFMKVKTDQQEVTEENWNLSRAVRKCLENYPLAEIPQALKTMKRRHSPLCDFNYNSWYYYR